MTKCRHACGWPPKGSYPHPEGSYIVPGSVEPGQRIRVIGHMKAEPDYDKLAKALIELAEDLNKRNRGSNQS